MIATVIPINLAMNYEPNKTCIYWVSKYLSKMICTTGLEANQKSE